MNVLVVHEFFSDHRLIWVKAQRENPFAGPLVLALSRPCVSTAILKADGESARHRISWWRKLDALPIVGTA